MPELDAAAVTLAPAVATLSGGVVMTMVWVEKWGMLTRSSNPEDVPMRM
jgi:hypothetical protein